MVQELSGSTAGVFPHKTKGYQSPEKTLCCKDALLTPIECRPMLKGTRNTGTAGETTPISSLGLTRRPQIPPSLPGNPNLLPQSDQGTPPDDPNLLLQPSQCTPTAPLTPRGLQPPPSARPVGPQRPPLPPSPPSASPGDPSRAPLSPREHQSPPSARRGVPSRLP